MSIETIDQKTDCTPVSPHDPAMTRDLEAWRDCRGLEMPDVELRTFRYAWSAGCAEGLRRGVAAIDRLSEQRLERKGAEHHTH